MRKCILFLLIFYGIVIQLFAQNYVDIAKLNYGYVPRVLSGDGASSTGVHDIEVGVVCPLKLNENIAIITGVDFSDQSIMVDSIHGTLKLYSVGLRLGASIKHFNKWTGLYIAIPKFAGDFGKASANDFQIGGVVLWKYSKSENFKYKFGFYTSTEEFGLITTPIIGGYYLSPNKKFEANVSLPIAFNLNYKIAKPVRVGIDFNAIVRSYNLSGNKVSSFYVHRWVKEVSAFLQFDLFKERLILKTKLVYAMNDFGLYEDGDQITLAVPATELGDDRIRDNKKLESAFGVKASLVYRFQLK